MEIPYDTLAEDSEYGSRVLYLKCNKESPNQDIFEKYNIKALPTFLFFKNNEQVGSPITECHKIEDIIRDLLNTNK